MPADALGWKDRGKSWWEGKRSHAQPRWNPHTNRGQVRPVISDTTSPVMSAQRCAFRFSGVTATQSGGGPPRGLANDIDPPESDWVKSILSISASSNPEVFSCLHPLYFKIILINTIFKCLDVILELLYFAISNLKMAKWKYALMLLWMERKFNTFYTFNLNT